MKKPLILIITDTHLNHKNINLVIDIFRQALEKAKELGLKVIYHGGDIFDSRKHQTLATLKAFAKILDMFSGEGIMLRAIPGNHDKPDYWARDSYLDIYGRYKSLELVRDYKRFPHGDFMIHMIPFFDEKEVYSDALKLVKLGTDHENILITHVAVDGVRNNDGSEIEDTLSTKSFKMFDKVLVGHYHNKQEVSHITYIGSAFQKDYGEDPDKGVTVVYDDGSLEQIILDFPKFETVKIDLNTITQKSLDEKIDDYSNSDDNIRFKFSGTQEKLSTIDKPKLLKLGIDVKTDQDDPEIDLDYATLVEFSGFDTKKIIDEWGEFNDKHKISKEIKKDGLSRLKNTFKEIV